MTVTKQSHEGPVAKRPRIDEQAPDGASSLSPADLQRLLQTLSGPQNPSQDEIDPAQRRLFPLSRRARTLCASHSKRLLLARGLFSLSEGYLRLAELAHQGRRRSKNKRSR